MNTFFTFKNCLILLTLLVCQLSLKANVIAINKLDTIVTKTDTTATKVKSSVKITSDTTLYIRTGSTIVVKSDTTMVINTDNKGQKSILNSSQNGGQSPSAGGAAAAPAAAGASPASGADAVNGATPAPATTPTPAAVPAATPPAVPAVLPAAPTGGADQTDKAAGPQNTTPAKAVTDSLAKANTPGQKTDSTTAKKDTSLTTKLDSIKAKTDSLKAKTDTLSTDSTSAIQKRAKIAFLEIGGPGLAISANYDVRFGQKNTGWGVRIGAGGFVSGGNNVVTIPLQFNYLYGKGDHLLELGAGTTYLRSRGDTKGRVWQFDNITGFIGTGTIGYRYQPVNGRLNLRVAFVPIIYDEGLMPIGGISVGYSF